MSYGKGLLSRPAVAFEVQSDGFKATNYDLTCRDFQYEQGVLTPRIPSVRTCEEGYHYCKKLKDTFSYYNIFTSRFFKVQAKNSYTELHYGRFGWFFMDKSVSEQITLLEEFNEDEVFEAYCTAQPFSLIQPNLKFLFEEAAWNFVDKIIEVYNISLDLAIRYFNAWFAPFCYLSYDEGLGYEWCNYTMPLKKECYWYMATTMQVFKDLRKMCLRLDEVIDKRKKSK